MDSISPNDATSPSNHHNDPRRFEGQFKPTQAFADRVLRALRHRLLLLYRSDPDFYVLGATGNVYTVNISARPNCTCPDRATPCKHILFVLIRVLGVPLDDHCLRRRSLRPYHVSRLLASPSSPESLAGPTLRERFHQVFLLRREIGGASMWSPCREIEAGATCPICLEEMGKTGERMVACGTCRNPLHEECLLAWKRTQRRRSFSCVICRSRWRDRADQERYLNLAAYVSEDDVAPPQSGGETQCGE